MKNFTNNFKQFTSRLSARWLIMALMMLVGTSSVWATMYVAGTMNSWNTTANAMSGSGTVSATFQLAAGNYEYRIVENGNNWHWVKTSTSSSSGVSSISNFTSVTGDNVKFTLASSTAKYTVIIYYVTSSNTTYVKATLPTYTISYNANGGSEAPSSQTKNHDKALTLSTTEPTRSGYTFQNWNTKADGTGTSYASGASYTANEAATLYAQWELACTPSTSITSATLNQNGTISLVGNFTTCGTQYHGFQWRIKGQEWCAENDPNSNSGYVTKQTDVDGEDTDTFTPKAGNTYEFRTYIYGSPWVYSSEPKEVEVPCPTIAAPTFSVSSKIACKNVAFNLNELFPRTDSGAGTLEWYKKDGTKVADPTIVSISATTQYYAVLKDGLCSSANSSYVTVNIYTPTISSIKITPYSYGITVQATITGSDLQSMVVECIEKGGDWANAKKCNQSLKGSGNATCSIEDLVAGSDYQVRISANTKTCSELFTYSAVQDVKTTCDEIPDAPGIIASGVVCPNTNITLSDYNNGIDGVKWYSDPECNTPASATVSISSNKIYYARIEDGGCASDASTLSLTLYPAPQTPVVTISPNPVGQNKPTTLTVSNYDPDFNYTIKKDGKSAGDYTAATTINIGEARNYEYTVTATSKVCPALTATSKPVTLEVQEAGVKIIQLGDLKLCTNIITDFVPMYVQKDGIVDVAGATAVKGYTWQFSANGTSDWANCTTNYADKAVGMTNGTAACNNWRADKVGYYRCLISYEGSNETQTSNALQVTGTTGTAPAINAFANFDMPVISINTGSKSLPDECSVVGQNYPSTNIDGMKKKISVDVRIYNPNGTLQYDRKGRINYRGSSSLNFKKKSYAFVTGKEKTKNSDGDVDTGKANLFGLSDGAKDKDWVLYAATPDPSMMRNRLVFDLYKEMTGKWGVNSMYVELIINNEYKGVYVLMDKITMNEKRVNITDYNGFIVKFDKTDKVDRVENTEGDQKTFATTRTGKKDITTYDTKVDQLFEIEYPEKEDIEDEGGNWTSVYKIIQERFEEFETALYNKEYEKVRQLIDYNSWADWFIINEYTKNLDAYRASCLFVYNGDKIEAQPLWDQELSFNNVTANISAKNAHSTDGLLIKDSGVYSDNFKAPFWFTGGGTSITGGLLNDPCFVSTVKSKWAAYTAEGGVLTTANISKKVAAFAEELDDAIDREEAMLPFNDNTATGRGATSSCTGSKAMGYYGFGENCGAATTHEGSKGAITTWVTNRIPKLTEELDKLTGQALIFILSPANAETTPWKGVNINVQAPEGYEYTLSHDELDADGAIISESGHMLNIRIPRPSDWGTGGNGTARSKQYNVKATIEVSGENACGTVDNNEATANIILMDVTEDCDPEIIKK